jgi:hypothetical protein
MKTNEELKRSMIQEAEESMVTLIEELAKIEEGDLPTLEQHILTSAVALGRKVLEQVLQQQATGTRPSARREGSCGHHQRLVSTRPKQFLSLLGKITIQRGYYQCLGREKPEEEAEACCSGGVAPFDEKWGMSGRRTTPGVQKLVSVLAASMTLQETVQVFERWVPLAMSPRQALHLLQPIGEAFAHQEEQDQIEVWQQALAVHAQQDDGQEQGERIKRVYVEMDGIYARIRRGSVVLTAEEQQREGDVYREMKVGAVFVGEPGRERSALVPGVFVDQASSIHYVAGRFTAEAFGPHLYALAHRCGLPCADQVVALGDGAPWIWNLVSEHFPAAVQIVDLWHAREHVWDVARAAFGRTCTQEAAVWAKHGCSLLAEGKVEELIEAIRRLPPVAPEPGASRSVPDIEADYFCTNAERMRYPVFRAQGMHIGSGIAEAACKTVVSTRAKRSGMRWTPAGLKAILALRTAVLNQEFDQRWDRCLQLAA